MSERINPSLQEKTVVIVGVGLIGGSIAAALKQRGLAQKIVGVGRNQQRLQASCETGLIDDYSLNVEDAVLLADLVIFCTPVDVVVRDVRAAIESLEKNAAAGSTRPYPLMTDVGSVKLPICSPLENVPCFIGSHPIAGSHRQGFEAADSQLFQNRVCVITPATANSLIEIERLERFWSGIGMRTLRMSPLDHDRSLAMTSHLPHVVAAALAATLSEDHRELTGTGFRDTTRIAAGDPGLWTGILMNNADAVIEGIDEVQKRLGEFRELLTARDEKAIRSRLAEGQEARSKLGRTS